MSIATEQQKAKGVEAVFKHHQEFYRHLQCQRNSGEPSQRRKYKNGSPERHERVRAEVRHVAAIKLARD